jgi:hypothetical protein
MSAFIMPDQKLLVVETNNLQFGSSSSIVNITLNLDKSVTTDTPTVVVTGPTGAPFTITTTNANTPNPQLAIALTGTSDNFTLGANYTVTVTANGNTDTFNIVFLISEAFNPTDWNNSNPEDSVGGFFNIQQIPEGGSVTSVRVNTIFRSLVEFISLVNFKITDIINRYRLKKNLADIVNSAIYAGAIPAGYTGIINYVNDGSTNIDSISLQDTVGDSDSFTLIKFNYTSQTVTIVKTDNTTSPATVTTTTSTYNALSSITVNRVTDSSNTIQYVIATINVTRSNITFTSSIDSSYAITMPLVNGWTVA